MLDPRIVATSVRRFLDADAVRVTDDDETTGGTWRSLRKASESGM
ncbi:MAG TPA: hypothetical protein VGF91_01895 [Solirubrobacteraceae bacterium]